MPEILVRFLIAQHFTQILIHGLKIGQYLRRHVESRGRTPGRLPDKETQLRPLEYSRAHFCGQPFIEFLQTDYILFQFRLRSCEKVRSLLRFDEAVIFERALETHIAGQIDAQDCRENGEDLACKELGPAERSDN